MNFDNGAPACEPRRKSKKDYDLVDVIGEGSYSIVYKALDRNANVYVALKVLSKEQIVRLNKVKYVHIEKECLYLLCGHPFIVALHATFQDAHNLYFDLELAEHGDLLNLIKESRLSDEKTRFIAAELLLGLEFIHQKNIVHRDIKPENILLDGHFHVRISDFGSAKIFDKDDDPKTLPFEQRSRRNSYVGTAEYVCPEILCSSLPYCLRSTFAWDLWSYGCVLFHLLAGYSPFSSSSDYYVFQKILKLQYTFPANFPYRARNLIESLLVLDPTERLGVQKSERNVVDFSVIKKHPYFDGVEWEEVECRLTSPFLI